MKSGGEGRGGEGRGVRWRPCSEATIYVTRYVHCLDCGQLVLLDSRSL